MPLVEPVLTLERELDATSVAADADGDGEEEEEEEEDEDRRVHLAIPPCRMPGIADTT